MNKGSTLIEVLIYAVIYVIVVSGMVIYAFAMLMSSEKSDMRVEVADNARFLVQKMERILQGAVSVNSPVAGVSSDTLSINTATTSWNPFVIDVASDSLRFKRGLSSAVPITNSLVIVSSVSFKNYSFSTSTKNTIRMKAKVTSIEPNSPTSSSIDIFISIQ